MAQVDVDWVNQQSKKAGVAVEQSDIDALAANVAAFPHTACVANVRGPFGVPASMLGMAL